MRWHVHVWSNLAVAFLLNCTVLLRQRVVKLSLLLKNSLPKTTSKKAAGHWCLWYVLYYFFTFQLQMSLPWIVISPFGTCVSFESSTAHVLAVTGTLIGDCFTQIRWELSFVKECLSLTIMVISSLWPRCEYRMSTCISQILWLKKQTSALKEKQRKKQTSNSIFQLPQLYPIWYGSTWDSTG